MSLTTLLSLILNSEFHRLQMEFFNSSSHLSLGTPQERWKTRPAQGLCECRPALETKIWLIMSPLKEFLESSALHLRNLRTPQALPNLQCPGDFIFEVKYLGFIFGTSPERAPPDGIWKSETLCTKWILLLKAEIQGLFWLPRLGIYPLPAKPHKLWLVVVVLPRGDVLCLKSRMKEVLGRECWAFFALKAPGPPSFDKDKNSFVGNNTVQKNPPFLSPQPFLKSIFF